MRKETVWRRKLAAGIAGAACIAALAVIVALATSAGGSSGGYTVRAIFDDAGNIIPGEDVKIGGVKVGTVGSVTPTPQAKAAVILHITKNGYESFRADASCEIRPQALIGEKYVDCLPTQPRVEGTPLPGPLKKIPSGREGAGDYLMPVQNTHSPVDIDLLGDINRLPERERFTLILNELGAGLAGRGSDLSEVIKRANPALAELDKVLAILASENKVLAKLASDSDRALAPFARVRNQVADFIVQSNKVAQATAAHRGAVAKSFQDFPPFLEQFGPAMERIARFAEQTTPTFTDLKAAAPGIDKLFEKLPAFSKGSTTFFTSLGKTSKQAGPALVATKPLLSRVKTLGETGVPFASNAAELLSSLRDTGGLERIMDFIFMGTGSANGYDALGHFLRAEGVGTACLSYAVRPATQCNRRLFNSKGSETGSSGTAKGTASSVINDSTSLVMARTLAVLKGASPAQALAKYPGSVPRELASSPAGGAAGGPVQPVGGSSAGTTYYAPSEADAAGGMLLNYLLGN